MPKLPKLRYCQLEIKLIVLQARSTILGILGTLGNSTRSFPLNNLHGDFHAHTSI